MNQPGTHIERGATSDAEAIAETLLAALDTDPFVRWLARPTPRAREAYVALMLEGLALPRGQVWLARDGDAIVGASLWAPPHTFALGLGDTFRLLPRMLEVVGFRRLSAVGKVLDAIERDRPPEPRWLLTLVGVVPERRGRGIGAALLEPGIRQADAEGAAVALETADRRNLSFYERAGFAVTASRSLAPGGPESFTLVRPPS